MASGGRESLGPLGLSRLVRSPASTILVRPPSPRTSSDGRVSGASPGSLIHGPFRANRTPQANDADARSRIDRIGCPRLGPRTGPDPQTGQISASGIEQYWAKSKCRLDRWRRSLKDFSDGVPRPGRNSKSQWPASQGVLEEILTGEVLTRVWTAVLCAYDRTQGTQEAEPVARSVMIGHMEARHRVLTLLVRGPGIDAEAAVKLNQLRRRTERWTDMLVGYLSGPYDVGEFAIDPHRAEDFAEDLHYQSHLKGGRHVWPLVLGSLRAAFRQGLSPASPNADLNAEIAAAILACFPPDLFDSTGLLRSLWLMRLSNATNDAQGLLDDLLSLDDSPSDHPGRALSKHTGRSMRRFGDR